MTEDGWKRSVKPFAMLHSLSYGQSDRKFRLFATAIARLAWEPSGLSQGRIQLVETAEIAIEDATRSANVFSTSEHWIDSTRETGLYHSTAKKAAQWAVLIGDEPTAFKVSYSLQAALLRDIFGNPFRPVTFAPQWRTEATVGIASQMYDSRDFGNMPTLSDALQDAGCEQADILNHCREPGPHVRGCWVVDLVLGKS